MINFKNIRFTGAFPTCSHLPPDTGSEVTFVGRSNVGKSSIINAVANRKNLAKSSSTPGKTREIVYFELESGKYLTDLPGYGYAKVSKKEQGFWANELSLYICERESLKGAVLIMDMRHPLTDLDKDMMYILRERGLAVLIVLNKADKLKQGERVKSRRKVEEYLSESRFPAVICEASAFKKRGIDKIREIISGWL